MFTCVFTFQVTLPMCVINVPPLRPTVNAARNLQQPSIRIVAWDWLASGITTVLHRQLSKMVLSILSISIYTNLLFFSFFSVSIVSCACTIHIHVFPLYLHTLIFLLFDRIGCITSSLHLEFTLYKTQQGHIHSVDPVLQVARAYSTSIQSDNLMLPSFVF